MARADAHFRLNRILLRLLTACGVGIFLFVFCGYGYYLLQSWLTPRPVFTGGRHFNVLFLWRQPYPHVDKAGRVFFIDAQRNIVLVFSAESPLQDAEGYVAFTAIASLIKLENKDRSRGVRVEPEDSSIYTINKDLKIEKTSIPGSGIAEDIQKMYKEYERRVPFDILGELARRGVTVPLGAQ